MFEKLPIVPFINIIVFICILPMPLLFRCKYIFYIVLIKIYKHLYFICLLFRHLPLYTFNDHYFWWLHMLLPCSLRTEKLRERNRLFPESWAWASIQDSSLAPTCSVVPRCHDGMFPRIASCPRRGWKNRGWGVEENTVARRAHHFPAPGLAVCLHPFPCGPSGGEEATAVAGWGLSLEPDR